MWEFIVRVLPLLKLVLVFSGMLAGIRCRLGIGWSILGGSLLTGLLFGQGFIDWAVKAAGTLVQPQTLFLAAIVASILLLSDLLEKSGQARRLMEEIRGYLTRPRLRLVFFPALIGLLPMPGGAVFSAPMLKMAAEGLDPAPREMALINYWFRHIWELCWPLYPGMILAASLAGVKVAEFVGHTWPGTAICLLLGCWFYLRPSVLPLKEDKTASGLRRNPGQVLWLSLPLLMAIIGSLGLELYLSSAGLGVSGEFGILIGLGASVIVAAAQNRMGPKSLLRLLWQPHLGRMLFVIVAIFIFKETLTSTGVAPALANLAGGGAALLAASVLLPMVMGIISGITMAFVGASFPMILSLLEMLGKQDQTMAYAVLAMFSGYAGVMVSPLHICFLLTCQYFEVDLAVAWRKIFWPSALLFGFGIVYFLWLL